jgi:hypothetical protein
MQASIGRDVGVAVITTLYMGLFLWLRPFRTRHRSRLCTSCIARPTCAMAHSHLTAFARWKLVPRIALLAFTILAATVNISQRSSSNQAIASPTTIALSAALFVGVALLLVALPAAFFRAKLQDGRERARLRKVPKINALH